MAQFIYEWTPKFTLAVHGGAPGADTSFDAFCAGIGIRRRLYPASKSSSKSSTAEEKMPVEYPLDRNKKIARDCDIMLAAPFEDQEIIRSGTWSTVRYSRKAGKPIYIIQRNGQIRLDGTGAILT
ncbi:MAG: hypothetical protein ABIP96_03330 [Patescibacteria group bacterium]